MASERYPRRHPDTAFRPVDEDGGLVVRPGHAVIEVLNPVGSRIFALLDGKHTVEAIVETVVAEYDVSEETARDDTAAFLGELESHGLLAWDVPETANREE